MKNKKTKKHDMIQLFIVRGERFVYDDKIGYSNLQNEDFRYSWYLIELKSN